MTGSYRPRLLVFDRYLMNILLTGATGNLGKNTLPELVRQGHRVRCFVRRPGAIERIASRSGGKVEVAQGDMRQAADLARAVQDVDVVIHLAYMIPPGSEDHPELARSINVDGTRHL